MIYRKQATLASVMAVLRWLGTVPFPGPQAASWYRGSCYDPYVCRLFFLDLPCFGVQGLAQPAVDR